MIRYARLVPVDAVDPLMVASHTREPLPLELPGWTGDQSLTPVQRLASMQKAHSGPIYPHQLASLVPASIRATALPREVWDPTLSLDERRKLWQRHLAADHYVPWDGGDQSVVERLEPDAVAQGLGIFGVRYNSIRSMLTLMDAIREPKMLMHYIAIVSLQFYVIKRGGFMRVRTDIQADGFSDALPPYLMLHFREDEARMPSKKKRKKDIPIMQTAQEAAAMARKWEFPMFLFQVFRWVRERYPDQFGPNVDIWCFCDSKVAKNTLQYTTCMRFRHVMPTGFEFALRLSHGHWEESTEAVTTNKCFSAPKIGQMLILTPKTPGVSEFVPFVFCHHMFQPHTPILTESADEAHAILAPEESEGTEEQKLRVDAERKLMWKVMCYMPIQEYEVGVHKRCMKRWRKFVDDIGPLFPTDHRDKLMQYDAYVPLQRPHYLSYVLNKKSMFVYVQRMHWPTNLLQSEAHMAPVPDDADLCFMSDEAFEWCATRGRVCSSLHDAVVIALSLGRVAPHGPGHELAPGLWGPEEVGWTPWTAWLVRQELAKSIAAPRDAFVYMKVVQLLTGREEDGIATVVRGPGHATFTELRERSRVANLNGIRDAHRLIATNKGDDPAFVAALHAGIAAWDRCNVLPFPPTLERTVLRDRLWDLYFPPSRVRVGGGNAQWIERFRQPSPCAGIRSTMERLYRELQTDAIQDEIKACEALGPSAYSSLPNAYRHAWTMLLMLNQKQPDSPPPRYEGDGASSSSSSPASKRARVEE